MGVLRSVALAALLTLPWALAFFSLDADGAFSIHDSIIYGVIAETEPQWSLNPHHPGFHVLQNALMPLLGACGVDHPGFVAARILAGIGAACALVLIARLARGRALFGMCCAAAFACTRICAMESAVGEVNLPGIAAALWALREATRGRVSGSTHGGVRPWHCGASIAVALCMRQDSILLLPAFMLAAWMGMGPGRSRTLVRVLAWSGVATLAFYAVCFQFVTYEFAGRQIHFHEWLVLYSNVPQMAVTHTYGMERLALYARSLGGAIFGQHSEAVAPHFIAGCAWCAVILGAAWMARVRLRAAEAQASPQAQASADGRRLAVAVSLALCVRVPFFTWFEPENVEWHALNVALIAALAAGMAAVPSAASAAACTPRVRWSVALLLVLCAITLWTHGGGLLQLRERRLIEGVEAVVAQAGPEAAYITMSNDRAAHALRFLHIYPRIHATDSAAMADAWALLAAGRTIAFITDRAVGDALPWNSLDRAVGGKLMDALQQHHMLSAAHIFHGPAGPYGLVFRKP